MQDARIHLLLSKEDLLLVVKPMQLLQMWHVQLHVVAQPVLVMVMTGIYLDNVIFILISKTLTHPNYGLALMLFIIGDNLLAHLQIGLQ